MQDNMIEGNKTRRIFGEELALIRGDLSQGKRLNVTMGETVRFEPAIMFKCSSPGDLGS